jgi:hypothetical protein
MINSEPLDFIGMDGRSRVGRIGKSFRTELVAELGGDLTEAQSDLVDQAVKLRVSLLGRRPGDALQRLMQVRQLLGSPHDLYKTAR